MSADLVLAIDCSTTGVKCIIFDTTGTAISTARASLDLSVPQAGWGEQDPEQWWSATCEAVNGAVSAVAATHDVSRIAAVCVTNQRETFVCLDENGVAVRPAMLWLDSRASREVEESGTAEIHEITGKPANTTPAFYKLLWLQKHEPEALARTSHVVDVHGYLVQRMTGAWRTSIACADSLGLVDLRTSEYDDGLCAQVGLTKSQLSELVRPGDLIGHLTDQAASTLGLPAGLRMISGAGDGQAAALGADISRPGTAYINIGTGLVSGSYGETYRPSRAYRAMAGPIPDTYSFEVFVGVGTYLINWFITTFIDESTRAAMPDGQLEKQLSTEAAAIAPGCNGLLVLPYWNGAITPYWDHSARGMMFGFSGEHGRAHIYRAVLEGLAYELRLGLTEAGKTLTEPIETFVAMGGGAKSELWCQIIADVLQQPITLSAETETTCLGAAMLAAAGAGLFPSIREAASAMSCFGRTFTPDASAAARYTKTFEVYRELYPATRALLAPLAEADR